MQDAKGIKEESLPIPPEDQKLKMGPEHAHSSLVSLDSSTEETEIITQHLENFQSTLKAIAQSKRPNENVYTFTKPIVVEDYFRTKEQNLANMDFQSLYTNLNKLLIPQLAKFADLVHCYFENILLSRSTIYSLCLQQKTSLPFTLINGWLEYYSNIGKVVREKLPPINSLEFCQKAGKVLFDRGYYQFEPQLWTTETIDLLRHPEWQEYYRELNKRLVQELMAASVINSGRVAESNDLLDTGITIAGSFLPIIGSAIIALFKTGHSVAKHRKGAKISRWIDSVNEIDDFSHSLALNLTNLRKEQLLNLKTSDFSLLTQSEYFIQEFTEATTYELPSKLAFYDMSLIRDLLSSCPKSDIEEKDSRVAANTLTLQTAFKQKLNEAQQTRSLPLIKQIRRAIIETFDRENKSLASPKGIDGSAAIADTKGTPQSISSLVKIKIANTATHAWHFYQVGIKIAAACEDHKAQENLKRGITQLQQKGNAQQHADYLILSCLSHLSAMKSLPTWQTTINLFETMQQFINLPYQECPLEFWWSSFSPIWSATPDAKDFHQQALQNHLPSIINAPACELLHSQVMLILKNLKYLGQAATADEQARRYHAITIKQIKEAKSKKDILITEIKSLQIQEQITKKNHIEWEKTIEKRQQELANKLKIPIEDVTRDAKMADENVITTVSKKFAKQLQTIWQQSKENPKSNQQYIINFNKEYGTQFKIWEQNWQQTFSNFKHMCFALHISLAELENLINAEQTLLESKACATIQSLKDQLDTVNGLSLAWDKAGLDASNFYRSTTKSIASYPSSTPAIKEQKREVVENLIQRLETEIGQPPCGFAVLSIQLILNKSTDEKIYASPIPLSESHIGILIVDPSKGEHSYWPAFARVWQWHQQCQDPLHSPATETTVWVSPPLQLANHLLLATTEGHSKYETEKSSLLFSQFETERNQQLKQQREFDNEGKKKIVSYQRIYGYDGLCFLFNSPLPTLNPEEASLSAITNNLLIPLNHFILHLGMYCEISLSTLTSAMSTIDALIKQGSLSPAFATDLHSAVNWSIQQSHAIGKRPSESKAFSAERLQELNQYYTYTVKVLWQNYKIESDKETMWKITQDISQIDPLWEHFEQTRMELNKNQHQYENVDEVLNSLIQIILHRKQFSWEEHRQYLFDLPDPDRLDLSPSIRLQYLLKLERALPAEQQHLIKRLRLTPTPSGQRLTQEEERQQWENNLKILWQPITADKVISPLEQKTPLQETASDEPTLSLASEAKAAVKESSKPIKMTRVHFTAEKKWELETHILQPVIADQLFKSNGEWVDKDEKYSGNHRVYPIIIPGEEKPRFWIKVYPEQPSIEYLITELDRRLGINGTPYFELVKFKHEERTSAAIIVAAVNGISLHSIKQEPEKLGRIAFSSFVKTLLRVLLTNPEDDKENDYFLIELEDGTYQLIRIDNERAFFHPTMPVKDLILFKLDDLAVKSFLYCLEQMKQPWSGVPAITEVVKDFLSLHPVKMFKNLLLETNQIHDAWNLLFSQTEVEAHFKCKDPWSSLPLMGIPKGLMNEIVTRCTTMQEALRLNYQNITGLQLLKVTQPKLAQYYRAGFTKDESIDHKQVQSRYERMVRHLYQKDSKNPQGADKSSIHYSIAMQHSLRLEMLLDFSTVLKIRNKLVCSSTQALAEIAKWEKNRRAFIFSKLLSRKSTAVNSWVSLPLGYQALLYEEIQKKALAKMLSIEQQLFILDAMKYVVAKTKWPKLDFKGFETVLTNDLLEPILIGAEEKLQQLNVSKCKQLTNKSLLTILNYNPNLRYLFARQINWTIVSLNKLAYLEEVDLTESAIQILTGKAPRLRSLKLDNCRELQSIGESHRLQNEAFSAEQLAEISFGWAVYYHITTLFLNRKLFFNNFVKILPHTPGFNSLKIIAFQTDSGWVQLPEFIIKLFSRQMTGMPYEDLFKFNREDKDPYYDSGRTLRYQRYSYYDHTTYTLRYDSSTQFKQLISYLAQDCHFDYLSLKGGPIDDLERDMFAKLIIFNSTLTKLDLTGNEINIGEAAKIIASSLNKNTSIKILNLSANKFGDEEALVLAQAIKINTSVTSLDLSSNRIGGKGSQAFAIALQTNTTLTSLNLYMNAPNIIESAEAWVDMFKTNTTLTDLRLTHSSDVSHKFLGVINAFLKRNHIQKNNVTCLSIDKYMSKEGFEILAELLRINTKITSLVIFDFNNEGEIEPLTQALKDNKTAITTLTLRDINDNDTKEIAEVLKFNKTLTELIFFHDYHITTDILYAFAQALKINTSLVSLSIFSDSINKTGFSITVLWHTFVHAVEINTTLVDLYTPTTNKPITTHDKYCKEKLEESLTRNRQLSRSKDINKFESKMSFPPTKVEDHSSLTTTSNSPAISSLFAPPTPKREHKLNIDEQQQLTTPHQSLPQSLKAPHAQLFSQINIEIHDLLRKVYVILDYAHPSMIKGSKEKREPILVRLAKFEANLFKLGESEKKELLEMLSTLNEEARKLNEKQNILIIRHD